MDTQFDASTQAFKKSMRLLAGAVSVITVGEGDERTGFTATSVSSLSADVPTVVVCVNRSSSSWPIVEQRKAFCVNVLAQGQENVARLFSGAGGSKGTARYAEADWSPLATGACALDGALTVLDCELEVAIPMHSHAILVGRVKAIRWRDDARPLLYWNGEFGLLEGHKAAANQNSNPEN